MTTLKDMEKSQKELKHELMKICWYMRGGVSYAELLELPLSEYKFFNEVVEDNMKLSKEANQIIL